MKHEPKIYLVDIDGTLTKDVCFAPEECKLADPNLEMIKWVKEKYKTDFIIIYTARRRELYEATMEWLDKYSVPFHSYKDQKTPGIIVDLDAINSFTS